MDRKLNDILEIGESQIDLMNLINVERLIEKYPYSSVLHVYAAKFSSVLNNQNKGKRLLLAAAYVSERTALKDFMERPLRVSGPMAKPLQEIQEIKQEENPLIETKPNILDEINSYREPDLSENPTKEEVRKRFLKIENPKAGDVDENWESGAIESIIKKSANSDFKIVTETMAQIYLKQGNKEKALQIYRQLLADNPKKSVYFASRISELETE
jgi:tetratricopeptide (TPR) repeat protein